MFVAIRSSHTSRHRNGWYPPPNHRTARGWRSGWPPIWRRRGLVIISGMARGVDTASHRGAIPAKGKMVAVFGTGVDVICPQENSRWSEQILALGGTLISEFPLSAAAFPQKFPHSQPDFEWDFRRSARGGSGRILRNTNHGALEQNRDVFAVPGNVTNKNSWGPHTLIKQGAKLVATWKDVWEDLPPE